MEWIRTGMEISSRLMGNAAPGKPTNTVGIWQTSRFTLVPTGCHHLKNKISRLGGRSYLVQEIYGRGVGNELKISGIFGPIARTMAKAPTDKQQQRARTGKSKEPRACPQPN